MSEQPAVFCAEPHPFDDTALCHRLAGHTGQHAATGEDPWTAPERLADLLPGVVADLAARHHSTNGAPPMTEPLDPVYEAVEMLHSHRHDLAPDVLRSLADIWACAVAARYGEPHEEFWVDLAEIDFYATHNVAECEAEAVDGAA